MSAFPTVATLSC